jgi:hypothetical protein
MQNKRIVVWFSLLAVLLLMLAGCAPRPGAGETAAAAPADAVVVDLPSIALDVASDGSLSMAGIPLAELGGALGVPLEAAALPADAVAQLAGLGVQHIQVVNAPNGLMIYLNGQAIPSIGWTAELLGNAAGLAPMPALAQVLPILTQLGIGVTLRLPVAEGAEAIPLQVSSEGSSATRLAEAQDAYVSSVGTPPMITIPVYYAADGTWTVAGLSGEDWQAATGQDFWKMLNLRDRDIKGALGLGIKEFGVRIDPNGLGFSVNGTQLPYIDWQGGKLASVVEIASQAGLLDSAGIDPQMLQTLLDTFLPIVTASNVNITAHFPEQ